MRGFKQLLFTVLLATPMVVAVADSMRCGRYIVSTGDSQSRVLDVCGEPQRDWQDGFIERIERRNSGYYADPNLPKSHSGYETEERRLIPVYRWEYNLGSGTLLKTLTFHGDILVGITDGPRQ